MLLALLALRGAHPVRVGAAHRAPGDQRPSLSYHLLPRLWKPRHGRPTGRCVPGTFGSRTAAAVTILHGDYHLSDRMLPRLSHDFFGLPISLGSVVALQQTGSAALAPIYDAIHLAIQQQDRCNIDETSWKEAGKRRWLWTMVMAIATFFYVATSRNGSALSNGS